MKSQKGITLIALVITIIVLLILAGVAIAMLTGENGILKKATNATDATGQAEANEAVQLALSTILANKNDPTYNGQQNTITGANLVAIMQQDNSSATVKSTDVAEGVDKGCINITYKASSNAKEYTVKVDSSTGKIKK